MNLNTRCAYMLPNHLQCANTAQDNSTMCALHIDHEVKPAVTKPNLVVKK